MINTNKSDSIEQRYAENYIFESLKNKLNIELEKNPKIHLTDKVHIEPDFYSENAAVVGEIFSHIGKMNDGQRRKISKDFLKLLLLDKVKNKTYKKIFVFCDEISQKEMTERNSWLAEAVRQFGIEVIKIDVSEDMKNQVLSAQKRQQW